MSQKISASAEGGTKAIDFWREVVRFRGIPDRWGHDGYDELCKPGPLPPPYFRSSPPPSHPPIRNTRKSSNLSSSKSPSPLPKKPSQDQFRIFKTFSPPSHRHQTIKPRKTSRHSSSHSPSSNPLNNLSKSGSLQPANSSLRSTTSATTSSPSPPSQKKKHSKEKKEKSRKKKKVDEKKDKKSKLKQRRSRRASSSSTDDDDDDLGQIEWIEKPRCWAGIVLCIVVLKMYICWLLFYVFG